MENAGRILLMPKGDYSASTTYAMLDIVNHSGASWVCKQACTGQTPSDSNTAYWQRLGIAVNLANYLPLTGGKVTAQHYLPLGLKNANGNNSYIQFEGKDGVLGYIGFESTNVLRLLSSVGGSLGDILHTGNFANYALPLSGGTLEGNANVMLGLNSKLSDSNRIVFSYNGSQLGQIGFNGINNPIFMDTGSVIHTLLHTGNKPSGTYTGNGDATERRIETGGTGSVCMIWKNGASCIATSGGAFGMVVNEFITSYHASFINGTIIMQTTDDMLNASGETYYYQVL